MAATATTVMNTITDTEEKALEALVSVQAPVVEYVRKAVDYVETAIPDAPDPGPRREPPDRSSSSSTTSSPSPARCSTSSTSSCSTCST